MSDFCLDTYHRNYLEGMTALYNAETAFEPHIAKLDPDRFIALVEKKTAFDPNGLFVAVQDGRVVGWIHAAVAAGSEGHHDPENKTARIQMLIYPRECLKVGGALVAEATHWLRQSGKKEFEAMHAKNGYPFYRGLWMGGEPMGPASMPHVQLALEVGGYKNTQEALFMTAQMSAPPPEIETPLPLEFVEAPSGMKHAPMRESWIGFEPRTTKALMNGEEAGNISWVVLPPSAERLGAPAMNIWGLGVRGTYRRQGIGAALIGQAMTKSYREGARFASVGTQLGNAPAHAAYAKMGFRPHCVLVGRALTPAKEPAAA